MTTGLYHNPNDRVMAFIDGSNLFNRIRDLNTHIQVGYGKFVAKLVGERRLVRSYYYAAQVDQNRDPEQYRRQQSFQYSLKRIPRFEVRLGRLVYPPSPEATPYEKGVDVRLATDMVLHAAQGTFDVAILVSSDTDFENVVQRVKDLGKNVEVVLFGGGSQTLRLVADEVIEVDQPFLEECQR